MIAIFRSCLRKEYRDQVIKMLRAVSGEFTRTSYRLQWVDEGTLQQLLDGKEREVIAFLVNHDGSRAMPCRRLVIQEAHVDPTTESLRLTLEIGDFLIADRTFDRPISEWAPDAQHPPDKFVVPYEREWPEARTADGEQHIESWKRSVSFVTSAWDFGNSVFFRVNSTRIGGEASGGVLDVVQLNDVGLTLECFNPHLDDATLRRKRLNVAVTDAVCDVKPLAAIPRDGQLAIDMRFLDAGSAVLQLEVRPDPQFSAFLPIRVNIARNPDASGGSPRVLGPEWRTFLNRLTNDDNRPAERRLETLEMLLDVFPRDPELLLNLGRLRLLQGDASVALDRFLMVLEAREDARAVTWALIAALRLGNLRDAERLIERLNLSETELFDELVEAASTMSDETIEAFADLPGLTLSEDKALLLLRSMANAATTESANTSVVRAMADINPTQGARLARRLLDEYPTWSSLGLLLLEIADKAGLTDFAEDEIELILASEQRDAHRVRAQLDRYGRLLPPSKRADMILENASRILGSGEADDRAVALTLSLQAARIALTTGLFRLAERALRQVLANTDPASEADSAFRATASVVAGPMLRAAHETHLFSALREDELLRPLEEAAGEVAPLRIGIAGEDFDAADLQQISNSLPDHSISSRLDETDGYDLVLVSMSSAASLDTRPATGSNARFEYVLPTVPSIVAGLMRAFDLTRETLPTHTSVTEAVTWARKTLQWLRLGDAVDGGAAELDRDRSRLLWAKRATEGLNLLNEYGRGVLNGTIGTGIEAWAPTVGWPAQNLSGESESTLNNPRLRQSRTFQVDVGSMQWVLMDNHLKLARATAAARIHFSLEFLHSHNFVAVGHVGPHLPLKSYS